MSKRLLLSLLALSACGRKAEVQATPTTTFSLAADDPQLGYDADFVVRVTPRSEDFARGRVTWAQVIGRPLTALVTDADGNAHGHTVAHTDAPHPAGLVSLSYDEAGQFELIATWTAPGRPPFVEHWHGGAIARSNGLPSIAVGHAVQLAGPGWHLAKPEASFTLVARDLDATVTAARTAHALLRDDHEVDLPLRAGRYDETPLDCGRSDCHPTIASEALGTKMTTVLARGLEGAFGPDFDPRCAIACHAIGEPGLHDGGFVDVARSLAFSLPRRGAPGTWATIPRALRRLGGVGCTACHGPGAIPDKKGRWAVLRVGVCAVCHDAAPRYGHVAAWRSSRMARSDAAPDTRTKPECARCHSTFGFLRSLGETAADAWGPPDNEPPVGITCAACHAAHAAHEGSLVRQVKTPVLLGAIADALPATSRVCLPCHTPDAQRSASQAAIWLGGTANPHGGLGKGCLGCHAGGSPRDHGASHSFAVDWARCQPCHEGVDVRALTQKVKAELAARAAAVAARLGVRVTGPHPSFAADGATPRERALRDLQLVLGDPSAAAHNAAYARTLLGAQPL